jgi:hypothetical protein
MERTFDQIAEDFSRHRFAETYPYLCDDARWNLVGDKQIVGTSYMCASNRATT